MKALVAFPLSNIRPISSLPGASVLPLPSSISKSATTIFSICLPVVNVPGIDTKPSLAILNSS